MLTDKARTKIKSLRLSPELIAKIEAKAKTENRTFSNMVETLLINYLKQQDKQNP